MRFVNRAAFVVRPRDPYVTWAASVEAEPSEDSESLRSEVSIYLVPEEPTGREETPPIHDFFEEIFEAELAAWCTDESLWPAKRDLAMFLDWFDVTGQSVITDLGGGPIVAEEA
jgi:hypothetical protein